MMLRGMRDRFSGSASAPSRAAGQRLWRLRKLHQSVDAELEDSGDAASVRFFYNGELAYERRWPTRALALAEAAGKRLELEREGWTAHW
jgi:hypothetical protein